MIKPRSILTALAVLTFTHFAPAAQKLTDYFPADSLVVVHSDNSPEFRRQWKASPWAKMLNDEQVLRFVDPMLKGEKFAEAMAKIKTETGKSLEEILELFNAQVGLAITRIDMDETSVKPEKVHGVLIVELAGKRAVLEEMLKHGGNEHDRVEEFRGVEIHQDTAKKSEGNNDQEAFWAIVDDFWIVATPREAMEQMIVNIQQHGATDALSKAPGLVAAIDRAGNQPFFMYMNAAGLVKMLGQAISQGMEKSAQKNPQGNPLGLTGPIILRASGLDTLEGMYLGLSIGEDYTESHFNISFTEERGITRMFAASTGNISRPDWVRADWTNAAVLNLPLPHVYQVIEEIVGGLNPGLLTMMQGQLQMMQQNIGIDLKRDLIEVLGDAIVVGFVPDGGEPNAASIQQGQNLIAFSTKNPQQLVATLETFGTMGGKMPQSMFEIREYLGAKIYTMPANPKAPPTNRPSFAVQGGFLLFTPTVGARPIETVLQSMYKNEGDSLWDKPQIKKIIAELPDHAIGYSYQDMAALFAGMFDALAVLQTQQSAAAAVPAAPEEAPADEEDDTGEPAVKETAPKFFDVSQKPTLEQLRRYWSDSVGGSWRDARSLYSRTKISHRPAKQ